MKAMNIIKNSKADRKGPHTLISSIGGVIVLLALALMLSSCGKDSSGHGKGAIAFSIKMPAQPASQLLYKAAAIPCIEYGITSVDARVYDSVENLVATGGPWPCDTGEGTISGIEEGSGYIVSLSLKDSYGNVVLRGSSDPLQVVAGQVTDAEIELTSSNNPPVFDAARCLASRRGWGRTHSSCGLPRSLSGGRLAERSLRAGQPPLACSFPAGGRDRLCGGTKPRFADQGA